jgi:Uma2 family endonuclease
MDVATFQSATVAPWAEIVPDAGSMTVHDLLCQPEDDAWRYELVEGILVRVAGSRARATKIGARLLAYLLVYVEDHGLGTVTGADGVYDFESTGQKDTGLIPDVGFYTAAREPLVKPNEALPFAPDLAVEVVSPTQNARGIAAKVQRYLAGGTSLVWVVWPDLHTIDVWRCLPTQHPFASLSGGDMLDGEDVVPGFTYSVSALFR